MFPRCKFFYFLISWVFIAAVYTEFLYCFITEQIYLTVFFSSELRLHLIYFVHFSAEEFSEFDLGRNLQGGSRVKKLLFACYYATIAHSELICYFIMVLNQLMSASILAMPLPIMVFLWAMLSVPRPTKRFWVSAITYTEVGRQNQFLLFLIL